MLRRKRIPVRLAAPKSGKCNDDLEQGSVGLPKTSVDEEDCNSYKHLKRVRRRKMTSNGKIPFHRSLKKKYLDSVFLIVLFIGVALVLFIASFVLVYIVEQTIDPHGYLRREVFIPPVILHYDLYKRRHEEYQNENSYYVQEDVDSSNKNGQQVNQEGQGHALLDTNNFNSSIPGAAINSFDLSSYGEQIIQSKCEITVVFMDPRLPSNKPGSPAYYSLESVAMYLPNACIVLHTSKCYHLYDKEHHHRQQQLYANKKEQEVYNTIYNSSFPLFQAMIQSGNVRVSFLDHTKYQLKSCDNYDNPSRAFMNYNFWNEEFINDVDSDLVLIMQDDSILCHSFDIDQYRKFAFVGAVWPKISSTYNMNYCVSIPIAWKTWTLTQKQWEKSIQNNNNHDHGRYHPNKPDTLLDSLEFPDLCPNDNSSIAPIGNGGFSLRSRKYMMKAIKSCPHHSYSGLDLNGKVVPCRVLDRINEDLYFAIVLRGIRAPLPTAFEASLFSLESLWPEEALEMYGGPLSFVEQRSISKRFWGISSSIYQGVHYNAKFYTIPVGMHKPWMYQSRESLLSSDVINQCPMFQFIVPPYDEENNVGANYY